MSRSIIHIAIKRKFVRGRLFGSTVVLCVEAEVPAREEERGFEFFSVPQGSDLTSEGRDFVVHAFGYAIGDWVIEIVHDVLETFRGRSRCSLHRFEILFWFY